MTIDELKARATRMTMTGQSQFIVQNEDGSYELLGSGGMMLMGPGNPISFNGKKIVSQRSWEGTSYSKNQQGDWNDRTT